MKIKSRWLRIILRSLFILVIGFIALCFVFDRVIELRATDKQYKDFFAKNHVPGEIRYYNSNNRRIRYLSIGDDSLPVLLFIHGSPSSTNLYTDYYKDPVFLRTFKMLAVDRPGYGFSGLGQAEPSIEKQAQMIMPVLDSMNCIHKKIIIMGESYGTSIACRIAMDHPGLIGGLVLVGPSLAPGEEKIYWVTPLIESPLLNWFIPRIFQSANTEKINHKMELEKMLPLWSKINIPVLYLQGANDQLIYTSNANFAKEHLINTPLLRVIFFKNRTHFIARNERPAIRQSILDMLHILSEKGYQQN